MGTFASPTQNLEEQCPSDAPPQKADPVQITPEYVVICPEIASDLFG